MEIKVRLDPPPSRTAVRNKWEGFWKGASPDREVKPVDRDQQLSGGNMYRDTRFAEIEGCHVRFFENTLGK